MVNRNVSVTVILWILAISFLAGAFPQKAVSSQFIDYTDESSPVLYIRLVRDMSLDELLETTGYTLDEKDMVPFLTDFSRLNPGVTVSKGFMKGMVVKLPLKHFTRQGSPVVRLSPVKEERKGELVHEKIQREPALLDTDLSYNALCDEAGDKKPISQFSEREKAEKFLKDVSGAGYQLSVCREIGSDGETVYKVFVKDEELPSTVVPPKKEPSQFETARRKVPEEKTPGRAWISGDIFGKKQKNVHPYLSVTALYTDNIYKTAKNKESDFVTIISPGIWIAVPHVKERFALLDVYNLAPGGIIVETLRHEYFRRFQAYLSYQADIELYSDNSDENTVNHRVHGSFAYRIGAGFSVEVQDEYLDAREERGLGISLDEDEFSANLFNVIIRYEPGRKTMLRVLYSNFIVDYDASENSYRDRMDNVLAGAFFYKIRPKLSLFAEYEYVDINYDEGSLLDGDEQHLFGGIQWDITAKTRGFLKAGYGMKEFDSGLDDEHDFILEANVHYRLTPKISLYLKGWRKTVETDVVSADYIISHGVNLRYRHRLTHRITGVADVAYTNENYEGSRFTGFSAGDRDDDYYRLALGVEYRFRRWLSAAFGYIYSRRESNIPDGDYSSNSVYFNMNGSI